MHVRQDIRCTPFEIESDVPGMDASIKGEVRVAQDAQLPQPVVVLCHGFKGFKEWGFIPHMAETLAADDFTTVSFNYSLNGDTDDDGWVHDSEKFKSNTFAQERDDVERVVTAVRNGTLPEAAAMDGAQVILAGHSRGGAAVLQAAARDEKICAAIVLASIAAFPEMDPEAVAQWRQAGEHWVENTRTGQKTPLGTALLEEMSSQPELIMNAAKEVCCPTLIVHGEGDETVPVAAAHALHEWIPESTKVIIEEADHAFGIKHPMRRMTDEFERVITEVKTFLHRVCGRA